MTSVKHSWKTISQAPKVLCNNHPPIQALTLLIIQHLPIPPHPQLTRYLNYWTWLIMRHQNQPLSFPVDLNQSVWGHECSSQNMWIGGTLSFLDPVSSSCLLLKGIDCNIIILMHSNSWTWFLNLVLWMWRLTWHCVASMEHGLSQIPQRMIHLDTPFLQSLHVQGCHFEMNNSMKMDEWIIWWSTFKASWSLESTLFLIHQINGL